MQITPDEIDKIEEAGTLNESPVKLIRTTGGYWIAIGRKRKTSADEALAAGSHPAIVKYNMEKQFPDFAPILMKSEGHLEPVVDKHSHFLSDELRKSGYDIFSVQSGSEVEFQITKQNSCLASVKGLVNKDHLFINDLDIPKQFSKAIAGATVEKAIACKVGLKLKK